MAITYEDQTGVVIFDGAPRITPIVDLFFAPFSLSRLEPADDPFGNAMYIRQLDTINPTDWADLCTSLADAKSLCGIAPKDVSEIAEMLLALAGRFGRPADQPKLLDLIHCIRFDETISLVDIYRLVMLLNDGHNLKAINLMGGYHCDQPRLWHFGGFTQYEDARVALQTQTSRTAVEHAALIANGKAPEAFADMVRILLASIKDPALRKAAATAMTRAANSDKAFAFRERNAEPAHFQETPCPGR